MKATKGQMRSGFTLVELLVVISIIVVLAGLAVPTAMKALGKADQVTGINNAKGIRGALDLFASDFDGEFPSEDTATELAELTDESIGATKRGGRAQLERRGLDGGSRLGDRNAAGRGSRTATKSSNEFYQQLIGRGLDTEDIFFHKAYKKAFVVRKPNSDKVVDQGENVWGYIANLQQTSSGPTPIVFDAPFSTGDNPRFSKKIWDGRIIVARLDSSTRTELIGGAAESKDGPVTGRIDGERVNLFSPEALDGGFLTAPDLKLISDREN